MKRDQFDYWLVRQSGAPVRQKCVFPGYATEQDGMRVDVFLRDEKLEPGGTGNPNISFHCDYLVAADGSASSVRRALRPDQWASVPEVFIIKSILSHYRHGNAQRWMLVRVF